jgi:protein-S-isoprenylcysteine O-methyltransferase Ste14
MGLLRWLGPVRMLFPFPYNLLGLVSIVFGLGVAIAGAMTFRKAKTNLRPFKEADKLVTAGPFRFTRNPMYLGLALVLTGVWLLLGALSPLLGPLVFVVTADRWYIAFEERMLRQKFGPDFDAYCSTTRRWL